MGDKIQIAVSQFSPILGNFRANMEKHVQHIQEAKQNGADVIIFPELGLTGYQVQDLVLDVARTVDHPDILHLISQSLGIDIVFSFIEETMEHLFYISALYASNGKIVHIHRKVYLPTYGMFDDGRYFAAGESMTAFDTASGRMGLLICEDAWHTTSPYLLALDGARVMIVSAAGPARSVGDIEYFGSQKFWRQLIDMYAKLHGAVIVFANRVGVEDGVSFFGGSAIVSPDGQWLLDAPIGQEGLFFGQVDLRTVRRSRYITPLLRDEKPAFISSELNRLLDKRCRGGRN